MNKTDNNTLYATTEQRMDTMGTFQSEDIVFWKQIRRANQDYEKNGDHGYYEPTQIYFMRWLEELWGIKLYMLDNGNYSTEYTVISPDKYTLFLLKYEQ